MVAQSCIPAFLPGDRRGKNSQRITDQLTWESLNKQQRKSVSKTMEGKDWYLRLSSHFQGPVMPSFPHKLMIWLPHGMIKGKVFIVAIRERIAGGSRKSPEQIEKVD